MSSEVKKTLFQPLLMKVEIVHTVVAKYFWPCALGQIKVDCITQSHDVHFLQETTPFTCWKGCDLQ